MYCTVYLFLTDKLDFLFSLCLPLLSVFFSNYYLSFSLCLYFPCPPPLSVFITDSLAVLFTLCLYFPCPPLLSVFITDSLAFLFSLCLYFPCPPSPSFCLYFRFFSFSLFFMSLFSPFISPSLSLSQIL